MTPRRLLLALLTPTPHSPLPPPRFSPLCSPSSGAPPPTPPFISLRLPPLSLSSPFAPPRLLPSPTQPFIPLCLPLPLPPTPPRLTHSSAFLLLFPFFVVPGRVRGWGRGGERVRVNLFFSPLSSSPSSACSPSVPHLSFPLYILPLPPSPSYSIPNFLFVFTPFSFVLIILSFFLFLISPSPPSFYPFPPNPSSSFLFLTPLPPPLPYVRYLIPRFYLFIIIIHYHVVFIFDRVSALSPCS